MFKYVKLNKGINKIRHKKEVKIFFLKNLSNLNDSRLIHPI